MPKYDASLRNVWVLDGFWAFDFAFPIRRSFHLSSPPRYATVTPPRLLRLYDAASPEDRAVVDLLLGKYDT